MSVILTPLETLQGALTLVAVSISVILALSIALKYFKYKDKNFILFGLTWLFLLSAYWGDAISFVMIMTLGIQLDWSVYFFIGNVFTPISLVCWILAFTDLVYKDKRMPIILTIVILMIIYEIIFFSMAITDISLIGTVKGPFIVEFTLFIDIFLICSLIFMTITFMLFILKSFKSENLEAQLKGKFLFMALLFFIVAAIIDTAFEITGITVTIARIALIIASFSFYIGFILPDFIKKRFLK